MFQLKRGSFIFNTKILLDIDKCYHGDILQNLNNKWKISIKTSVPEVVLL